MRMLAWTHPPHHHLLPPRLPGRTLHPPLATHTHRLPHPTHTQIHWFSIFNSFMMVIFLTGLVSMILLRTLRKDYARYTARDADDLESLERDMNEESGWKLVRGGGGEGAGVVWGAG